MRKRVRPVFYGFGAQERPRRTRCAVCRACETHSRLFSVLFFAEGKRFLLVVDYAAYGAE